LNEWQFVFLIPAFLKKVREEKINCNIFAPEYCTVIDGKIVLTVF